MIGYILFFIILFIVCQVNKNEDKRLTCLGVVIFLFTAIRYGLGYDYYSYLDSVRIADVGEYSLLRWEIIPRYIAYFSHLTNSYFFFFITSAVYIGGVILALKRCPIKNYTMSLLFFIAFPLFFTYGWGVIRQSMAFALVLLAIIGYYGDWKKQLALIVVAYFCHTSAIIALPILLPLHKLPNKWLWVGFVLSFVIGETLGGLITSVSGYLSFIDASKLDSMAHYMEKEAGEDGRTIRYIIYGLTVLCLIYRSKLANVYINQKDHILYITSLVCIGAMLFAIFGVGDVTMAKRFCTFYFISIIVIIPLIVKLINCPVSIYYFLTILLFSMTIYLQSNSRRFEDPIGYSPTYPYRTMISNFNDEWGTWRK